MTLTHWTRRAATRSADASAALFPSLYLGLPLGAMVAIRDDARAARRCCC